MLLIEKVGIVFPDRSLLHDGDPLVEVADAFDIDAQAETIEELRPKLAFFRVHGADEDESRWMRYRHAFTLDGVDAHRRGIKQHVDDVVVQKVDLVDVEDVAVRLREHAWLEP